MIIRKAKITHAFRIISATVVGLVIAYPIIFLFLNSVMNAQQVSDPTPQLIPKPLTFNPYQIALDGRTQGQGGLLGAAIDGNYFVNSVLFVFFVVALQWMLCISGGLVISRMRFRGRYVITGLLALSLFIPIVTTVLMTYVVTLHLGLINTWPGLIIPVVAQTGFGTLLFRQFISQMPEELFDAARVDGAGWWTILRRLVIPLAGPATGAYVAISVITAWNMYLWPLVATSGPKLEVLTLALAPLANQTLGVADPTDASYAAVVLATLPVLIVFLFAQRAFVRGFVGSGVD
jgi:ABC-type glycerol-3-phosphate transport system permease component